MDVILKKKKWGNLPSKHAGIRGTSAVKKQKDKSRVKTGKQCKENPQLSVRNNRDFTN